MAQLKLEYTNLADLKAAVRNPKTHQIADIQQSIARFGYVEPMVIDERTGRLVAGHGRATSLAEMKAKGEDPPEGVTVKDGDWYAPVVRGWKSRSDADAEAYLLGSNQLVIGGGWDDTQLRAMLGDLSAAGALAGVGWSDKELQKMLAAAGGPEYTTKIEVPVYEPSLPDAPLLSSLVDLEKQAALIVEIEKTEGITDDEAEFLRLAAQRHVSFDYENIAEYYAHASPQMQRLMEKSALVIIDFDAAIENGFVKMTEGLAKTAGENEKLVDG